MEAVSIKEVSSFIYCCLSHKGPFTDIENVVGKLMQFSRGQNIFLSGPLFGIYYNSPEKVKPEELEWEMGFAITPQIPVQAPLEKKQWSFTTVVTALHTGLYEETGQTISKISKWMEANNYIQSGPVMERYLDANLSQVDPKKLRTEIWIPCEKIE